MVVLMCVCCGGVVVFLLDWLATIFINTQYCRYKLVRAGKLNNYFASLRGVLEKPLSPPVPASSSFKFLPETTKTNKISHLETLIAHSDSWLTLSHHPVPTTVFKQNTLHYTEAPAYP